MSRRKGKRAAYAHTNYWQSEAYNEITYNNIFYNQVLPLAMSRFKWLNLPASCDERYLEWILLWEGCGTIAYPESQPGIFYSTKAVMQGKPNIYNNPSKWRSIGNNGWNFDVDNTNGVFIYANRIRRPLIPILSMYARELTDIYSCIRVNRQHQKTPYILTGPQERKFDMINIYKQVAGGEPAVLANDSFNDINIDSISTGVPYLGKELMEAVEQVWHQIFNTLGISSLPAKTERQTADEIMALQEPTDLASLGELECRREAVDWLNSTQSKYLPKPIQVIWNRDYLSRAWDAVMKEFYGGDNDAE